MPIRFAFDSQRKILFTVAEGVVSYEEIDQHLHKEGAAGLLGEREVFDARAATTSLTPRQVRNIVAEVQVMMRNGTFGPTSVVTSNQVFFGMARMIAILSELQGGPQVEVFRTLEEGLSWLDGLPPQ